MGGVDQEEFYYSEERGWRWWCRGATGRESDEVVVVVVCFFDVFLCFT